MALVLRSELASRIDHTLLRPEASREEVRALCAEGRAWGCASVCVNPVRVLDAHGLLSETGTVVCSVIGFPFGATTTREKALEASQAIDDGASELDMVINLGAVKDQRWDVVAADVQVLRTVAFDQVLKVIIESAALSGDELTRACVVCADSGADFVKTSTGFHSSGGASLAAVKRMSQVVGQRCAIKASGGIRTYEDACVYLSAGASRLGVSSTRAILDGAPR